MNIGMKRNERDGDEGCLGVLGASLRGEVDTHMHILHFTFWGSWGSWVGIGVVLGGLWGVLGSSLVAFWGSFACYLVSLGVT